MIDVSDPTANATNLTTTYCDCHWRSSSGTIFFPIA